MENIVHDVLNRMKYTNIMTVEPDSLEDINGIEINDKLSEKDKILDYINKIKNPYCYRQGDYIVKLQFSDENISMTERFLHVINKMTIPNL